MIIAEFLKAVVIAAGGMSLLWLAAKKIKNAGIVDAGWAALIALLALMYALDAPAVTARQILMSVMMTVWGGRIAFLIVFGRVLGHPEDGRYAEIKKKWGEKQDRKLFKFFMIQAALSVFFSLPALIVSRNTVPGLSFLEGFAFLLSLAAVTGEAASDYQLERFKSDPASRGKTCRLGLWDHSRHPNYFFEFLMWCSVFLFSLSSPGGWLTVLCPVLIFYFLFKVTGIPKTEEQALRSRGEDYREYQRTTSVFVPWFKKKDENTGSEQGTPYPGGGE